MFQAEFWFGDKPKSIPLSRDNPLYSSNYIRRKQWKCFHDKWQCGMFWTSWVDSYNLNSNGVFSYYKYWLAPPQNFKAKRFYTAYPDRWTNKHVDDIPHNSMYDLWEIRLETNYGLINRDICSFLKENMNIIITSHSYSLRSWMCA